MKTPRELEISETFAELAAGTIWLDSYGSENTYYRDDFGNRFFCKNYPWRDSATLPRPTDYAAIKRIR